MHRKTLLTLAVTGITAAIGMQPLAQAAPASTKNERYIIQFKPGGAAAGKSAVKAAGGSIKLNLARHRAVAAVLPAGKLASLQSNPNVARIEIDARRYPGPMIRALASGDDHVTAEEGTAAEVLPYGVEMVQANDYRGNAGSGIKVCVIDSGYDLGHEDKPGEDIVGGTDDIPGAGRWSEDGDGHGTHVSGTINAIDNEIGVVGVFPGVPMHIVRVFGDDGLWAYSSELIDALDVCVANGAKVVNMSLGGEQPAVLENMAFRKAEKAGVLSIAAAGNDGNTRLSYPASYNSVVSVAAIDSAMALADFSQRNTKVELAAPGVSVLSTVPTGSMYDVTLATDMGDIGVEPMDNFEIPAAPVSGVLQECGLGETPEDCGDAAGKVCLIERGAVAFAQKAESCQAAGGVAAVIYQSATGGEGPVLGTLGETYVDIPVVGMDRTSGLALKDGYLGSPVSLSFTQTGYDYDHYDGTSMATPHVAGVAALVWSTHPQCSNADIRAALQATAVDLGAPGPDHAYGYGLVQAQAASDYLDQHGCGL